MRVRTVTVSGQSVTLREQGERVDVIVNGVVLLSSGALGTEEAFGALAQGADRVLVGGLGFGATARGALAAGAGRVFVAELSPAIVALLRGELAHLACGVLDDPRVELIEGDVASAYERGGFDAILLDVDNGPGWASHRSNARLYAPWGLDAARKALNPGGFFAVWSGYPDDGFLARLRSAGFSPSIVPLRERGQLRARAYVGRLAA